MKVVIACGHFMPDIGYVEVQMAKALSRLGHEVHVITSNKLSKSVKGVKGINKEFEVGVSKNEKYGYSLHRFRAYFSMGAMVKCRRVNNYVKILSPELLIFFGPGKLFPSPVYNNKHKENTAILTLLGDDRHFQNKFVVKKPIDQILYLAYKSKVFLLRKLLKDRVYEKAVKFSDHIMAYTPEVPEIIKNYIPQRLEATLRNKTVFFSLGFDPDLFYFDISERAEYRRKLKLKNNVPLLITCTRVNASKKLELVMDVIEDLNRSGKEMHYLIVGLLDDSYATEIEQYKEQLQFSQNIHLLPFMSQIELRKYYNAADAAYWPSHIISLYEAMGTGLPIILPNETHTKHLLTEGVNGWYFEDKRLYQKLELAYEVLKGENNEEPRTKREQYNFKKYSFDSIAQVVIDQAKKVLSEKVKADGLSNS